MPPLITLLTDFGLRDAYVAAMKGVILRLAPEARIIDVTHLIAPQDVREGAVILARGAPYFPDGTIHICVVDPGVGTARRPMAARLGAQHFVGPDNGLITFLHARAGREGWPVEFYELDRPQYWLAEISNVFHGRDIFAPVAAHLANGVPLDSVGSRLSDPILLRLSPVERTANSVRGEVIHIDHFGNLATNIRAADLAGLDNVSVRLRGIEINGIARAFGDRPPSELIALVNSNGELEVAAANGSAAQVLGAQVGDWIEVIRRESS
jgi:hypothetical protein